MKKLIAAAVVLGFMVSSGAWAHPIEKFSKSKKHEAKTVTHHNKHKTGPASNSEPSAVPPQHPHA